MRAELEGGDECVEGGLGRAVLLGRCCYCMCVLGCALDATGIEL